MPLSQVHYAVTLERSPTRESPVYLQLIPGLVKVLSAHAIYSWAAGNLHESFSRFCSYLLRPKAEEKGSWVEPSTARQSSSRDERDHGDNDEHDHNDGGVSVCREDVELVMGKLGLFCGHDDDEELISRNRPMSCHGISRVFEEEEASTDEAREAFYVFDVNRDGFIDAKELQRVLCVLGFDKRGGEGPSSSECERMISVFDENGDGRIDFQEFVKLVEKCFC